MSLRLATVAWPHHSGEKNKALPGLNFSFEMMIGFLLDPFLGLREGDLLFLALDRLLVFFLREELREEVR